MRHRTEIEEDASAIADKPALSAFELGQMARLQLEVLLDIRSQLELPQFSSAADGPAT
jgi:hypothetical protein